MPDDPSTVVPAELIEQLRELLADRLSVDEQVRREHGRDISRHPTAPPDVVVFPENNDEVQQIVRACAAFGAGDPWRGLDRPGKNEPGASLQPG
jgi:D-lactate dehydrogenase (cytochrome)